MITTKNILGNLRVNIADNIGLKKHFHSCFGFYSLQVLYQCISSIQFLMISQNLSVSRRVNYKQDT